MICPWCVLAHIICTSMSIPRTIQLERMTHMYVHTRYQVCTYVLHLYSRYQLYRLLYYIYSWSPFKHLGTQNIEHNRYSTATSPPLLPPPRSLVSGLSSAMLTLCSTGWARRPHASLSAVGNHFLRLTNLTSSKKNGYGRRKSVRNCFAVMLVESERSLSFSSCAQPHVPLSRLFLGQRVSFTRGEFSSMSSLRSWRLTSSRAARATARAAAGRRSSIPRTADIGCWCALVTVTGRHIDMPR